MCVCVRAHARACVCECVCVCWGRGGGGGGLEFHGGVMVGRMRVHSGGKEGPLKGGLLGTQFPRYSMGYEGACGKRESGVLFNSRRGGGGGGSTGDLVSQVQYGGIDVQYGCIWGKRERGVRGVYSRGGLLEIQSPRYSMGVHGGRGAKGGSLMAAENGTQHLVRGRAWWIWGPIWWEVSRSDFSVSSPRVPVLKTFSTSCISWWRHCCSCATFRWRSCSWRSSGTRVVGRGHRMALSAAAESPAVLCNGTPDDEKRGQIVTSRDAAA